MIALLVDGLNLVRRIHAAVPEGRDRAQHSDGVVSSCSRSLQRALSELCPTHALCAFDAPGPGWRHALKADYKANRPPMPQALLELLPEIESTFQQKGVRCVRVQGYEADDVLASVAVKIAMRGGSAIVLSTDKSMLSLLRDGIRVRNHFEDRELDEHYTLQRFGVAPAQLTDYLALVGDRSVNIPGVKSVGAKTAARLIAEHGSLHAILNAANDMQGTLGQRLRDGAEDALLSLQLVSLDTQAEVGVNLNQCRVNAPAR